MTFEEFIKEASEFISTLLPQTKQDNYYTISFIVIMELLLVFSFRGEHFGNADFSEDKIIAVAIADFDYKYADGRITQYIFTEENSYTKYYVEHNVRKIDLFFTQFWNYKLPETLYMKILTYGKFKDRTSVSKKSYKAIVLEIKQGNKLVYKDFESNFEKLKKEQIEVNNSDKSLFFWWSFISFIWIILLCLQIQFLNKQNNGEQKKQNPRKI